MLRKLATTPPGAARIPETEDTNMATKRNRAYFVRYKLFGQQQEGVDVLAASAPEAYDKAVYEIIPKIEGELPYSAWVSSVTYQNGNCKYFNNFEGKPY